MKIAARTVLILGTTAALSFVPLNVQAQSADVAQRLLDEAKKANDAGNIGEACVLLDRAYQLDAKDGILFARADCRDREGKIAAASSLYDAYLRTYNRMTGAQRLQHSKRAGIAEARIKELGPLIPTIKFVWAEKPPAETKIIIDGVEFPAATLEDKFPMELGMHEIIVRLPGEPERKRTVTLEKSDSSVVDLTPLSEEAKNALNKPPEPPKPPPPPPVKPPPPKPSVDPWKIGGFVGVGLGLAGIAGGTITGTMAMQEKDVVDAHCNAEHRCDQTGLAAAERFQSIGNISTASFIAGGALATVGATLLLVAYRGSAGPKASARVHTTFAPGIAQIGVSGAF